MNRNTESHFAELPHIDIERSMFDRSSEHLTSFNTGELIPFFWDEVLPGDTFNVTTSLVARLQTLLTPIFSNVYMDTYYFFIPARLCWTHWREFMGENTDSAWIPEVTYAKPKIESPENGWSTGTIADYMGIPVNTVFSQDTGLMPDALPFRAYSLICQEWFRDQNLTDPLNIPLGDAFQTGSNGSDYINDVANGGKPFKVAKYHDYFTSCLPSPQKGPSVGFNLNTSGQVNADELFVSNNGYQSIGRGLAVNIANTNDYLYRYRQLIPGMEYAPIKPDGKVKLHRESSTEGNLFYNMNKQSSSSNTIQTGAYNDDLSFDITNLYVPSDQLNFDIPIEFGFTINELRLAFQLQKFYEKNARGGLNSLFLASSYKKIAEKNWKAA